MSITQKLRALGSGKDVLRVQNKADKCYSIQFEMWEQREAEEWWAANKDREYYKNHELAKVRIHSQKDLEMIAAADEIERLRGLIEQVIDGKWCVTDLQESIGYLRADDEAETNG